MFRARAWTRAACSDSRLGSRSTAANRSTRASPPPVPTTSKFDPTSLRARFIPFPPPLAGTRGRSMSWSKVLEDYARLDRPERELAPGVFVTANRQTTVIFDGFEKARFHLLILPREPFPLEDGSALSGPPLASLSQLLKSPHALPVLKALQTQADEVEEMIRDEMEKEYGWSWGVQAGFHAVESMRHVHLHVISTDFLSPKLKNKKHWNSFHPRLGYFLHLSDVIAAVEAGKNPLRDTKHYEALLKTDLVSTYPPHATFATIPKLKEHLEVEWEKQGRARKGAADGGKPPP